MCRGCAGAEIPKASLMMQRSRKRGFSGTLKTTFCSLRAPNLKILTFVILKAKWSAFTQIKNCFSFPLKAESSCYRHSYCILNLSPYCSRPINPFQMWAPPNSCCTSFQSYRILTINWASVLHWAWILNLDGSCSINADSYLIAGSVLEATLKIWRHPVLLNDCLKRLLKCLLHRRTELLRHLVTQRTCRMMLVSVFQLHYLLNHKQPKQLHINLRASHIFSKCSCKFKSIPLLLSCHAPDVSKNPTHPLRRGKRQKYWVKLCYVTWRL